MSKPRPTMAVGVRLLHAVDAYLRNKQRGKGDMSKLIFEALRRVNLDSVPLITIHGKKQPVVAKVTQIVMQTETRNEIERLSRIRRCSMNELLNSALAASLLRNRAARKARSIPPLRAAPLNELTTEQREQFFRRLLNLNGQEIGPSSRSALGSYYEYDPELEATVENTQDGGRFLVESRSGGDLVRIRQVGQSPFLEMSPGLSAPKGQPKRKTRRRADASG